VTPEQYMNTEPFLEVLNQNLQKALA
jgi:hypothetical protein